MAVIDVWLWRRSRSGARDRARQVWEENYGPLVAWCTQQLDDSEAARQVVEAAFVDLFARWLPARDPQVFLRARVMAAFGPRARL